MLFMTIYLLMAITIMRTITIDGENDNRGNAVNAFMFFHTNA